MDRPSIASPAAPAPPPSAVSGGAGAAGLAGLAAWLLVARAAGLDGPWSALVAIGLCAIAMIGWSLLVDRVHRHASTGIDWTASRAVPVGIAATKIAGLWACWGGIALIYATGRFYWQGPFLFAMQCLMVAAPVVLVASIPYVLWLDRYLVMPRDGAWHLGAWLTGQPGADHDAIAAYLRGWGVKAFFLPFMLGGVPGGFGAMVRGDAIAALGDPVMLARMLIGFMFLVDMAVATVGYLLTFRPLDAHIRSADPHAAGWIAALICYPPFLLMSDGGPLDYHPGTADWTHWLAGHPWLTAATGAMLVALTGIYAAATLAFGPRFSNLTHRGIVTHGVYRWSRHPAYWAKNLFWWLATLPMLSTGTIVDAARATLLLGAVSGVYWWRARTEERHLSADPDYRAYADWIAQHGLIARLMRRGDRPIGQKLSSA